MFAILDPPADAVLPAIVVDMDAQFRFLAPDEGHVLCEAIRVAYGESYDVRWVYDRDEVCARLAAGTYVSCVAETADGELLCHEGMSLEAAGDAVAHSGQAVTMPAARGQHLFTRTKRFLMDWAREQGLAGMFSEATAAHPYSQRANIELGAHETGFLLGWIPATVSNDAAAEQKPKRQSAALFYTKLNDGHERPGLRAGAPPRDHRPDAGALRAARPARRATGGVRPARALRAPRRGQPRPQPRPDHGQDAGRRPGDGDRRRAPPPLPPRLPRRDLPRPAAGEAGDGAGLRPPRAPRRLLRGRLPQPPRRRRRAAHAVAAPGADHRGGRGDSVRAWAELLEYVLADSARPN